MSALAIIELIAVLLPIVERIIGELNKGENKEEVERAEKLVGEVVQGAIAVLKAVRK